MSVEVRKGTVCFLVQESHVLLVLIEYSPTDRKWTGIGGFVDAGESLEDAVVREAEEETFIKLDRSKLQKVAELNGHFQLNVFLTNTWDGEIKAKEDSLKEFKWFPINELPFHEMHPGSEEWMPKILNGKFVRSDGSQITEVFTFD